jgi:hypothetical protein
MEMCGALSLLPIYLHSIELNHRDNFTFYHLDTRQNRDRYDNRTARVNVRFHVSRGSSSNDNEDRL